MNHCSSEVMTNKKVVELDAEFIKYKGEAKASMDALEKKIDDGIEKLEASIKAMKEESDAKPKYWDVEKFHKLIIAAIKEEKNQEKEGQVPSFRVQLNQRGHKSRMKARLFWKKFVVVSRPRKPRKLFTSLAHKRIQRRTWDPGITWLKILKEHLEDKVVAGYRCALCRDYLVQLISSVETDRAQSSRVPTPLPDDPYMAVRQSYIATITDSESKPLEDSREIDIPHPLPISSTPAPPSHDPYLIVRQAHTPATIDTESEPEEAPSERERSLRLLSHQILGSPHHTPQLHQIPPHSYPLIIHFLRHHLPRPEFHTTARMAVHTQPTLSLGMSARIAEAAALSPSSFSKRYRSSYETPSPSLSLTLPIRKRYQGTSELIKDTKDESSDSDTKGEGSEDRGPDSEEEEHEEEAALKGQQQTVPVVDTAADEPLGLGYGALRRREFALGEGSMLSTFEIGQSSRYMSEQQRVEETPTPRPRVCATWVDPVDGTFYTDIPVDVPPVRVPIQTPPSPEWSSGSLPVSPSSPAIPTLVASPVTTPVATIAVDALPPTLFEGYDKDLRELYTRLREVRDEIFSQCYRLRSLEQEQERTTVTFGAIWRPVLALKSWA
ncbi:hypothetical protein Tco_1430870 [Tanacetum coccineum]